MDLQTILDNAMTARRAEIMKTSPQLTLGEIISKMEMIKNKSLPVVFDVEKYNPVGISSWRGAYEELALEYSDGENILTVMELLGVLRPYIGATLEGYKGGDYLMGKTTPVWVANYSYSRGFREEDYTAVVDILEYDDRVVIKTEALEY